MLGLVRRDGTLANAYEYSPWGEALSATEAVAQPLRYAARELDPTTGLYYVRARWYDPHLGRFLSEDPIGLAGGINPYAYADNDPTNKTDPYGMYPVCRRTRDVVMVLGGNDIDGERTVRASGGTVCTETNPWWRMTGIPETNTHSLRGAVHIFLQQVPTLDDFDANGESAANREAREREQRICDLQTAAFLFNATMDVSGLAVAGRAMAAGAKVLPALGAGMTTRIYGPSVLRTFRPTLTPTSASFVTGALDHGERYNTEDVWTSIQGVVPGWGSYLAWNSMQQACN